MSEAGDAEGAHIPTQASVKEQGIQKDISGLVRDNPRLKGEHVLHLIDTYKTTKPDMLPGLYSQLKGREWLAVDDAIAQALNDDKVDIVEALLTPGEHKLQHIDDALWRSVYLKVLDEDRQDAMWQTLTDIHTKKQLEFRAEGRNRQIDEATIDKILKDAVDPESALAVRKDFWERDFASMSESDKDKLFNFSQMNPFTAVVDAQDTLKRHGVAGPADYFNGSILMRTVALSNTEADAYASSLATLFQQPDFSERSKWELLGFRDPIHAATEARRLFPGVDLETAVIYLAKATKGVVFESGYPATLDEQRLHFIEQTKQLLAELQISDPEIVVSVCRSVAGREDELQRRERILTAKELLLQGDVPKEFIPLVLLTGNPQEATKILEPHWQEITTMPGEFKRVFDRLLPETSDVRWINRFFEVSSALKNQGIVLSSMESYNVEDLVVALAGETSDGAVEKKVEDFIGKIRVSRELSDRYHDIKSSIAVFGQYRHEDSLKGLSHFEALFSKIGIPNDIATKMYASWQTYDPYFTMSGTSEGSIREKIDLIWEKFSAVKQYVEKYGIEELLEVHKTFGIVNFTKVTNQDGEMELEKIHRQLERWKDPSEKVKVLSFNAVTDHNNAFKRDIDNVFDQVGEEGSFCFEVGTKQDMVNFIKKVGERERAAGRTPDVKVVRISAHGHPTGVELGSNESWSINDFPRKPTGELDKDVAFLWLNTAANDLGNDYLIVLAACLTAADVEEGGQNFASSVNEVSGQTVSAAKEETINTSLLPEGRAERVMHWVTRPDKPGPRRGVSRTWHGRMSKPVVVGS